MTEEKSIEEHLKMQLSLLPEEPGVYRFLDSSGVVIYVGKAKNLKKRVTSYFSQRGDHSRKVIALVRNICDIMYVVVSSEAEALLLENNMIKSLQPKYNILLKDDKSFPWIVVKSEEFPRILQIRNPMRDGSTYYGPYASVSMQKSVLDLVRKLYRIRTCNLKLTQRGITSGRFGVCLEYHIGNCKAPCVGYQSSENYSKAVSMAQHILKGNLREAKTYLTEQMMDAATRLHFEEAAKLKERLEMLTNYESRSVVVSGQFRDMDVFYPIIDGTVAYCNFMHIKNGAVINSYTIEMSLRFEESDEQILGFAIMQIYDKLGQRLVNEIVVPYMPDFPEAYDGVTFTVPVRGDKLKLLELSNKNCKMFRLEKMKQLEKLNPERHTDRVMSKMKTDLMLDVEPRLIECFDNSNIGGAYPVSSCVVFRDGKPAKREYRHFNIKTVEGIDDFASMRETILRRYSRVMEENGQLPDLIVVDGGKGQLSSAYDVLKELKLEHKIQIIGLAKRLEEVFYPLDSTPHYLDKSSETLKVLMYIRDEAHRFGITFHRNKRSKGFIKSELEDIKGIGQKSIETLIKHFGSVSAIKKAEIKDIASIVGESRAQIIKDYLK